MVLANATEDIKGWWIWGYWISPVMYGQNALMANEFLGNSWHNSDAYQSYWLLQSFLLRIYSGVRDEDPKGKEMERALM
ncbi:pleiotropic drug resistance protein 1-like, partial [Trifolium medium]|nr:pleiotropic drug resistance protein 1-like [Trifolium medium]